MVYLAAAFCISRPKALTGVSRQADTVKLKRAIGLPALTLYGLGNILGAGIYVLIGPVASQAGLLTPLAFLLACLVAAFSALTYAEMSSRFPLSAGEAVYVDEGLRIRQLSILVGLMVALVGLVSSATIIRGCFGYLQVFVELPFPLVIIFLVAGIGVMAIWGISQSVVTAALMTLVEIAGLLLVIWVGRDALFALPSQIGLLVPQIDSQLWLGIVPAAFLAFFAFLGFEDIVNIAEEVKQPSRNLPLAILLALLISSLFYFLVSVVAVLNVNPSSLGKSEAPLAMVFEQATGNKAFVLSLIGVIAVINGALVQTVMASRVFYGMANRGLLWKRLAQVNQHTRTPVLATLLVISIILVLALWVPLEQLAASTSFLMLAVFSLVNASLIIIKRNEVRETGSNRYPMWVPVIGLFSSLVLALSQLFA